MKTRLLFALLGAAIVVAPLSPVAFAQGEDTTNDYKRTWAGVATLKTLRKTGKTRELSAAYPVFGDSRPVAQVAGLVLKQEAVRGFNGFEKDSRGTAKQLDLHDGMKYAFELKPSLVLNRPHLISATTLFYQFTGGAHGLYGTTGYVFGFPNGAAKPRQLHLADFFTDGAAAKKRVNDLLMAKLRATKGKEQTADWVLDGEMKSVDQTLLENFVADKDGLTWYFGTYAMGSYAVGEFEVPLTRSELGPNFRASLLR